MRCLRSDAPIRGHRGALRNARKRGRQLQPKGCMAKSTRKWGNEGWQGQSGTNGSTDKEQEDWKRSGVVTAKEVELAAVQCSVSK